MGQFLFQIIVGALVGWALIFFMSVQAVCLALFSAAIIIITFLDGITVALAAVSAFVEELTKAPILLGGVLAGALGGFIARKRRIL